MPSPKKVAPSCPSVSSMSEPRPPHNDHTKLVGHTLNALLPIDKHDGTGSANEEKSTSHLPSTDTQGETPGCNKDVSRQGTSSRALEKQPDHRPVQKVEIEDVGACS